jgi:hypothetical protein
MSCPKHTACSLYVLPTLNGTNGSVASSAVIAVRVHDRDHKVSSLESHRKKCTAAGAMGGVSDEVKTREMERSFSNQ